MLIGKVKPQAADQKTRFHSLNRRISRSKQHKNKTPQKMLQQSSNTHAQTRYFGKAQNKSNPGSHEKRRTDVSLNKDGTFVISDVIEEHNIDNIDAQTL